MKNILVVGGSGLVGGNCLDVLSRSHNVFGTHLNFPTENTFKFNPIKKEAFEQLEALDLDIMIHTGALTHVDRCELEPELSYKLTVESTKKLVDFAKLNGIQFFYTSTDYVFDGKHGPYLEGDKTNPVNTYGRHKLEAEEYIYSKLSDFLIFRITNVYGTEIRGKNFVARTVKQLMNNESIHLRVPYDQFATPINAIDIAKAFEIAIMKKLSGIYHLGGTDYMSRVQILQLIQTYFDNRLTFEGISTEELNQKANRPLLGGLMASKWLREVPSFKFSNLSQYLNKLVS